MTLPGPILSGQFAGTWAVRRRMVDHRNRAVYVFDGTAIVTATTFEERGELLTGEYRFSSNRTYRLEPDGGAVSVLFPDGSGFIQLQSQGLQPVFHLCGSDHYAGRFFFRSLDHWAEAWRVHGPQKHYASLSHYRRIPASG